jgi:DNA repair protein RecN (Recombination protein N)
VDELSALAPEVAEEEALADRRQRLMQLEKAAEEVRDADEILNGPIAPGPSSGPGRQPDLRWSLEV